ncbi:MAG: zf-HC2 domain-containing protein [Bacillota bacterium]|jgi:anti-sigma factor RsiW
MTVECADVYKWLQAYLDASVTAEQERAVEAHIRACLECRRKLVELARAVNALERSEPLPPRAEFTRRLYEALQKEAGVPVGDPVRKPRRG